MDNRRGKVLIVEHDAIMGDFLMELLSADYRVTLVKNAYEALGKLMYEHWDVALIDEDLPEISGHELIDKICHQDLSLVTILMVHEEVGACAPEVARCDLSIHKPFLSPNRVTNAINWGIKVHEMRTMAIFS